METAETGIAIDNRLAVVRAVPAGIIHAGINGEMEGSVRIDKWLWSVRVFKTRSQATAACTGGKVQIGGQKVKPARAVKAGEIVTATVGEMTRTVKVVGMPRSRVGAKALPEFMEDLTPPEEYQKQRERSIASPDFWPKGAGRPTKKDRRAYDLLFGRHRTGEEAQD